MYDRNGVRLSLIHSLPYVAEANGLPVGQLLALGGLEANAFENRDQVVRRSQIIALMNGLARKSGDATIGLRMAELTHPDLLGPFGRSLLVGRTLGEALALQRRHLPWMQRGASITMESLGQTVQWTHSIQGCDPIDARFLIEGIAAFFVRFVRAATGDPEAWLHVTLPHRPVAPLSVYEDTLRCAVSFDRGRDFDRGKDLVIRFDAALLGRRNVLSLINEGVPSTATHKSVPVSVDLPDQVLLDSLVRMIEGAALWGRLTAEDASLTLGMSTRSLQRRLAQLDTSFERLVDGWRRDQAAKLLSDPATSTSSVAVRLGYTDPSHFIRAFRRWQGVSPTSFRRDLARNGN